MSIYSKQGDTGWTSLADGGRVEKDHPLVEACGMVDELNSLVGLLSAGLADTGVLTHIQRQLFGLGSCLATRGAYVFRGDTDLLEGEIDRMTEQLPPLRGFVLPGGSGHAALAHRCRTVCRTAERRVCSVARQSEVYAACVPFLNRLSDYFFVLARYINKEEGVRETVWEASSGQSTGEKVANEGLASGKCGRRG